MKRTLLFCLVSAVVGALAATAWHQTASFRQLTAQQPARAPATRPAPIARAAPEDPAGLEGFTAEERTNILVYEKTNRSVVHITTKAAQRELLFLEVPAEGAGSGSVLDKGGHILTNYHVVEVRSWRSMAKRRSLPTRSSR